MWCCIFSRRISNGIEDITFQNFSDFPWAAGAAAREKIGKIEDCLIVVAQLISRWNQLEDEIQHRWLRFGPLIDQNI